MNHYDVYVGNVGRVWHGDNKQEAIKEYREWIRISQSATNNKAYGEYVALFRNGELYQIMEGNDNGN